MWYMILGILLIVGFLIYLNMKPTQPKIENIFSNTRGILTLNPIPDSAEEIWDMGFNVLLPFGHKYDNQKQFIKDYASLGGKIIMPMDADVNVPLVDSIIGYFLTDEPDCRKISIADMEKKLQEMRGLTEKPIGCGFCGQDIGCGYNHKQEWIEFINKLDFVLLTCYSYDIRIPIGEEVKEMQRCVNEEWKDIKIPIIPFIQAHSGGPNHKWNLREPNPEEQVNFWKEMGFIIYPFRDEFDGVEKHKEEWKEALK